MSEVQRMPVADVVFRDDLYPRIETHPVTVQKYAEDLNVLPPIEVNQHKELIVCFGNAFPDVCPPTLATLHAGRIRQGVFYPAGSVSRHYFKLQQDANRQSATPHVYFIRAGDAVKIGSAADISKRLETLQCANPVELHVVRIIRHGGAHLERELHGRFRHHHLRGEWFRWCDEIVSYIAEIA